MSGIYSCNLDENPISPSKTFFNTFDCAEFIVEELKSWTTQRVTRFYLGSELGSIFRFIDLSGLAAQLKKEVGGVTSALGASDTN